MENIRDEKKIFTKNMKTRRILTFMQVNIQMF